MKEWIAKYQKAIVGTGAVAVLVVCYFQQKELSKLRAEQIKVYNVPHNVDSLINLNVENNKLSSNDWTTNCFGLDISALVTDYVSREEESILLKKFYILETSSLYKSYAIEYIKAIVGWISSSMENTTGLLSDLGLASVNSKQLKNLDMKTVEMEFGIYAFELACLLHNQGENNDCDTLVPGRKLIVEG